jgi:hypothetical protein
MLKKCIPPTMKRVAGHTDSGVNEAIRKHTVDCLNIYKDSNENVLSDRIRSLECEWDTERVLETSAASVVLAGSVCGFKKSKSCMFLLTGAAGFFLLQHALQGWCPPLPLIRRAGVRTAGEIGNERAVLKHLRGDFPADIEDADEMLSMAEK